MDLAITLMVLVGAVTLFITEKLPVDVVALLVLSSLMVTGVLTPVEALSGFSSQATLTVAAMFVLSAGLQRSGVIAQLGLAMARIRQRSMFALVMMVLVAFLSAFVNNTAVVAIFLPLVIGATVAIGQSPSKYLIPLSFAAQFGGVCTLVGTSTNLLVDSLARQAGQPGFSLLEFTPLGIWFVAIGTLYLMVTRHFLLPDLGVPDTGSDDHRGRYLTEMHVPQDSSAIGKTGGQALPLDTGDAYLLEIQRDGEFVAHPRREQIQAGDVLLLRGSWNVLKKVRGKLGLHFDAVAADLAGNPEEERVHAQVMVAPGSHLVDHTLSQLRFGHTYRMLVRGLQRPGTSLRQSPHHVPLAVGDILLVDAPESALKAMRLDYAVVVLGEQQQLRANWGRATFAVLLLGAVLAAAALELVPLVAAAILGCVVLVVSRALKAEEAYAAIDWRVIILLAGVLPLGLALQKSGGADWASQHAMALMGDTGPVVTLALIYLCTALLTEVMTNNGAAVLMVPIVISAAATLGVDAKPFLVAVAFAASTSFATPVGYQTNTMVYTAGGYRFSDFAKIGVPLNLLFWLMAVILIPRYFPF